MGVFQTLKQRACHTKSDIWTEQVQLGDCAHASPFLVSHSGFLFAKCIEVGVAGEGSNRTKFRVPLYLHKHLKRTGYNMLHVL